MMRRQAETIIPDHTGSFIVEFWVDENKVTVNRYPIIAWRVADAEQWAMPLMFGCIANRDEECDGDMAWCVEHRDRGVAYLWEFPNANLCSSLDEAGENARRLVGEHRDRCRRLMAECEDGE